MNNLLITKENKKTKRFILVFLLFTIYFFNGSLILAQNERISVNVKNESVEVVLKKIIPDDGDTLTALLCELSDEDKADLILTTGGTGFSKRDNTPEATMRAVERETPGISEAMRYYSLQITPRAMLSRGVSGIRKEALIVNLPGSPKAVRECLEYAIGALTHGIDILKGNTGNCAGK